MSIKGFEVGGVQQRYDYESLDNIPANLVQDANYVHTDNNYTNADKTKLSGIEAQANKTTIDATLTHSGQAADAKATGDAISALNAQVIASMPHDTASGSIASFPDGAAMPVIDCSVAVAPNQDLHGFDNPWPAGGGDNQWDGANGYWSSSNGAWSSSGSALNYQSSQKIKASQGDQFYLSCDTPIINQYVIYWLNGTFVSGGTVNYNSLRPLTIPSGVDEFAIDLNLDTQANALAAKVGLAKGSVPLSSWTPYSNICPISGWTECKVTRTGKNLWKPSFFTDNGFTESGGVYSGSSLDMNGVVLSIPPTDRAVMSLEYKGETTSRAGYFKFVYSDGSNNYPIDCKEDVWTTKTATSTSGKTVIGIIFSRSNTVNMEVRNFQLELGSTATAYEPYQGQTYTIDLDGTRYGGTLDVTSGKLTVDRVIDVIDGTQSIYDNGIQSYGGLEVRYVPSETKRFGPSGLTQNEGLVSDKFSANSAYPDGPFMVTGRSFNGYIYFTMGADVTTAVMARTWFTNNPTQISYLLATPIEVQLTPTEITTLLGTNNIFADCGDTTVSYYADTTLFVNKKIAAAVAALS